MSHGKHILLKGGGNLVSCLKPVFPITPEHRIVPYQFGNGEGLLPTQAARQVLANQAAITQNIRDDDNVVFDAIQDFNAEDPAPIIKALTQKVFERVIHIANINENKDTCRILNLPSNAMYNILLNLAINSGNTVLRNDQRNLPASYLKNFSQTCKTLNQSINDMYKMVNKLHKDNLPPTTESVIENIRTQLDNILNDKNFIDVVGMCQGLIVHLFPVITLKYTQTNTRTNEASKKQVQYVYPFSLFISSSGIIDAIMFGNSNGELDIHKSITAQECKANILEFIIGSITEAGISLNKETNKHTELQLKSCDVSYLISIFDMYDTYIGIEEYNRRSHAISSRINRSENNLVINPDILENTYEKLKETTDVRNPNIDKSFYKALGRLSVNELKSELGKAIEAIGSYMSWLESLGLHKRFNVQAQLGGKNKKRGKFENMKVKELRQECACRGITSYSKLNKNEMIEKLKSFKKGRRRENL
jgi:hypothetical protein